MRDQGTRDNPFGVFSDQRRVWGGLCSLLSWSVPGSGFKDFTQEKSVFCRIR